MMRRNQINRGAYVSILGAIFVAMLIASSCAYDNTAVTSSKCANSDLTLTITATTNASTCEAADGSIIVSASGGVVDSYIFNINGGTFQSANLFSNLAAGSYSVSVKDSIGCVVTQLASINNAQSSLKISIATTANSGCPSDNGTLTITATGGTEPYQYRINTGSYQASNTFTSLAAATYSVTAIDATTCPTSGTATVARNGPGFSADIQPIISTKCAISGCHNGSRSPNLSTYSGISANASHIKSEVSSKAMPPSNSAAGSLTQTQINLITCWVNDGALNN